MLLSSRPTTLLQGLIRCRVRTGNRCGREEVDVGILADSCTEFIGDRVGAGATSGLATTELARWVFPVNPPSPTRRLAKAAAA